MFAKLLKHDIRAVFKYWWIGAVASVVFAVFGGFAFRIMEHQNETEHEDIVTIGTITFIFCFMGVLLFSLFTHILLLIRYKKHFFTDEGYLTFTLPVKKTTLIDSKLAVAFIFTVISYLVTYIDLAIMNLISDEFFWKFFDGSDSAKLNQSLGGYTVPYIITYVLIACVAILCYIALMYVCITVSALIAKKHKRLVGIGIFALFTWFVSYVVSSLTIYISFGAYDYSEEYLALFTVETELVMLLGLLGILIAVFGILYFILTLILNKKLNLA